MGEVGRIGEVGKIGTVRKLGTVGKFGAGRNACLKYFTWLLVALAAARIKRMFVSTLIGG